MGRSIDRCVRSQSQSCLRSRQSWLMGSIEIRGVKRRSARGKRGWTCRTPRSLVRVSRPKGAPAARSLHAYMCARAVYLLARQRVSALDVPARSIDTSQIPCNLFKTGCLSLVVGYAALDPPSRKPSQARTRPKPEGEEARPRRPPPPPVNAPSIRGACCCVVSSRGPRRRRHHRARLVGLVPPPRPAQSQRQRP